MSKRFLGKSSAVFVSVSDVKDRERSGEGGDELAVPALTAWIDWVVLPSSVVISVGIAEMMVPESAPSTEWRLLEITLSVARELLVATRYAVRRWITGTGAGTGSPASQGLACCLPRLCRIGCAGGGLCCFWPGAADTGNASLRLSVLFFAVSLAALAIHTPTFTKTPETVRS